MTMILGLMHTRVSETLQEGVSMEITCDICTTVHMVTRPRPSHFCTVKLMVHIRLKICRISLKLFCVMAIKGFAVGLEQA